MAATQQPAAVRFATAADRLDNAATVLHGLHRRHKNQHRVSTYWWPALGQLRRHVRRVEAALRGAAATTPPPSAAARAAAHAGQVRAQLVPKAYLAFSRLVADKQFAPLGALLLGLLAQVHAALKLAEGGRPGAAPEAEGTAAFGHDRIPEADDDDDDGVGTVDLGVAVARDVDDATDAAERSKAPRKQPAPKQPSSTQARDQNTKKRSRPDDDAGDGDAGRVGKDDGELLDMERRATPARQEMAKVTKEKKEKKEKKDKSDRKAKKRKRNGDEFDSLFSGLL